MPRRPRPWQERIRAYFTEGDPDDCWLWRGALDAEGYGTVRLGGRDAPTVTAHRAVYMLLVEPIEPGRQLDHQCHNRDSSCSGGACAHRACVNPTHCEPATSRENTLRGRAPSALNAVKDRCPAGHAYDVTYTTGGRNYRACRACRAAAKRASRAAAR